MRVVLINFYRDGINVRNLASSLKQAGHSCHIIHFMDQVNDLSSSILTAFLNQEGVQLVGISLLTDDLNKATLLTKKIKESTECNIMWGGIHPTLAPKDSLQHADFVCLHEGEECLPQLCHALEHNFPVQGIDNIMSKNFSAPPKIAFAHDLSKIPIPDTDISTHWILQNSELEKKKRLTIDGRYIILSSRGCPYRCSYCINNFIKKEQTKIPAVRFRPIDLVIEELAKIKRNGELRSVYFMDDMFLARSLPEIDYFSQRYRNEISVPFFCMAHIRDLDENKISLLKDAGLLQVQLGIQSGNSRTREIYRRFYSNQEIIAGVSMLQRHHILPLLDFIFDNPYEDAAAVKDSIDLLLKIAKPYKTQGTSLILLPGCDLTQKALADKLIEINSDGTKQISPNHLAPWHNSTGRSLYQFNFNSREKEYFNTLLYTAKDVPALIIKILLRFKLPFATTLLWRLQKSKQNEILNKKTTAKNYFLRSRSFEIFKDSI